MSPDVIPNLIQCFVVCTPVSKEPEHPHEHTHVREAPQLPVLQEGLRRHQQPPTTPPHTHW